MGACDKKTDILPPKVAPEVTAALQETFALIDSPGPAPRDVRVLAERQAHRWNDQWSRAFADGLIARLSKDTFAETLFLIDFGVNLAPGSPARARCEQRMATIVPEALSGYPESLESLRDTWIAASALPSPEIPKARESVRAILEMLWRSMKLKDPQLQKVYKRIEARVNATPLRTILDRQLPGVGLIVEPMDRPQSVPLRDGRPRYTARQVQEAAEYAYRAIVTSAFADLGLDEKAWIDRYCCGLWLKRIEPSTFSGPTVDLRCRYGVAEEDRKLKNWNGSIELKALAIDLELQFEVEGKPVGEWISLRAHSPEKVAWDESKEGADVILLRWTLQEIADRATEQILRPR